MSVSTKHATWPSSRERHTRAERVATLQEGQGSSYSNGSRDPHAAEPRRRCRGMWRGGA